jgi:hypothetical protein
MLKPRGFLLAEWAWAECMAAMLVLGTSVMLLHMSLALQRTTRTMGALEEQWIVSESLREQLQASGYRRVPGASPSHDALLWDPAAGGTLSFQSDPLDPGGRHGRSAIRRQEGTLQWRPAGNPQFQAWTDPRHWTVTAWHGVEVIPTTGCHAYVRVEWHSTLSGVWRTEVHRRNRGPLACEAP